MPDTGGSPTLPSWETCTLLDWYAGQALSALKSFFHQDDAAIIGDDAEHIAETAYAIADAMLAQKRRREATTASQ